MKIDTKEKFSNTKKNNSNLTNYLNSADISVATKHYIFSLQNPEKTKNKVPILKPDNPDYGLNSWIEFKPHHLKDVSVESYCDTKFLNKLREDTKKTINEYNFRGMCPHIWDKRSPEEKRLCSAREGCPSQDELVDCLDNWYNDRIKKCNNYEYNSDKIYHWDDIKSYCNLLKVKNKKKWDNLCSLPKFKKINSKTSCGSGIELGKRERHPSLIYNTRFRYDVREKEIKDLDDNYFNDLENTVNVWCRNKCKDNINCLAYDISFGIVDMPYSSYPNKNSATGYCQLYKFLPPDSKNDEKMISDSLEEFNYRCYIRTAEEPIKSVSDENINKLIKENIKKYEEELSNKYNNNKIEYEKILQENVDHSKSYHLTLEDYFSNISDKKTLLNELKINIMLQSSGCINPKILNNKKMKAYWNYNLNKAAEDISYECMRAKYNQTSTGIFLWETRKM